MTAVAPGLSVSRRGWRRHRRLAVAVAIVLTMGRPPVGVSSDESILLDRGSRGELRHVDGSRSSAFRRRPSVPAAPPSGRRERAWEDGRRRNANGAVLYVTQLPDGIPRASSEDAFRPDDDPPPGERTS